MSREHKFYTVEVTLNTTNLDHERVWMTEFHSTGTIQASSPSKAAELYVEESDIPKVLGSIEVRVKCNSGITFKFQVDML